MFLPSFLFSSLIYKSVHGRERVNGFEPICDISWLQNDYNLHVNPLNIGQIVNNQSSIHKASVSYEEINLDSQTSQKILILLPNINYESGIGQYIRIVPLIALQDIHAGQELFSTYFSLV